MGECRTNHAFRVRRVRARAVPQVTAEQHGIASAHLMVVVVVVVVVVVMMISAGTYKKPRTSTMVFL